MCRSVIEGGRRCPSHTNPQLIQAYNAKRRERYHLKKTGAFGQPETTHVGEVVPPAVSNPVPHRLFGSGKYSLAEQTVEQEQLNISVRKATGELVDNKYFAATVVSGVLNYKKVDEHSHTQFGFETPGENYDDYVNNASFDLTEMQEYSEAELESMSDLEKQGLKYFTSDNYRWVNNALYSGSVMPTADNWKGHQIFSETFNPNLKEWDMKHHEKDENILHQVCNAMDSAMAKAPKKQRIVYRGMRYNSPIFKDEELGYSTVEGTRKWVQEHFHLGEEVKFDGYQSSSPEKNQALAYSSSGGVVFEILTSEGVNVTKISHFSNEKEVILPRDARYTVVGVHDVEAKNGRYNVVQLVAINEQGAVLDGTNASPYAPLPKN